MKKSRFLILIFVFLQLIFTLEPFGVIQIRPVYADDLQDAIDLGVAYMDRHFYQLNATHAVCKDIPALPIALHDETNDKWLAPAKYTINLDGKGDFYGGCLVDVLDWGYNKYTAEFLYNWDADYDSSYDGLLTTANLTALNSTHLQVYFNVTDKNVGSTIDFYLDDAKIMNNIDESSEYTSPAKKWGWTSLRYTNRHATKNAANLWRAVGNDTRALMLNNTWYGAGYDYDVYDPIWNQSFTYNDTIEEYEMGILIDHDWIDSYYAFKCPEIWDSNPWTHNAVPYRSALEYFIARDFWIAGGVWGLSALCKNLHALHYMNKYCKVGDVNQSALSNARAKILGTDWDGMGVRSEYAQGIKVWDHPGYVTIIAGAYLTALSRYYQLTGDEWFGIRADEVAAVIIKLQVKQDQKVYLDSGKWIYRPDFTGGFMTGYVHGSIAFKGWSHQLADAVYFILESVNLYHRDPHIYSCGNGATNTETTFTCLGGLLKYQELGRTPNSDKFIDVDFVLPLFDATTETSTSGEAAIDAKALSQGKIRAYATWSITGDATANITYYWPNISIPTRLNDFRTELQCYIPFMCDERSSLSIYVKVWRKIGTFNYLMSSDKVIPINGDDTTDEYYIAYHNLTYLEYIDAGTYHIALTVLLHSGFLSSIYVGTHWINLTPVPPMEIDIFGYSGSVDFTPQIPNCTLTIAPSIGDGDTDPTAGSITVDENEIINVTAVPDSGKYFWYFELNNTRMGTDMNITANPVGVVMDHNYNLTAYFGATPSPISNRSLSISYGWWGYGAKLSDPDFTNMLLWHKVNVGSYTYTPPYIKWYSITNGSTIHLRANYTTGYVFKYWLINGNRTYAHDYSFTLANNTQVIGAFQLPAIAIRLKDSIYGTYIDGTMTYATTSFDMEQGWNRFYGECQPHTCTLSSPGYDDAIRSIRPLSTDEGSTWNPAEMTISLDPDEYGGGGGGGDPPTFERSWKIVFYGRIPYASNYTDAYYLDPKELIYCQPYADRNATIKIVMHYRTFYPVIEIYTTGIEQISFNATRLYEEYGNESLTRNIGLTDFLGLKIDSDGYLTLILNVPHKPSELWKRTPGTSSGRKMSGWKFYNQTLTVYNAGDPTITALFAAYASVAYVTNVTEAVNLLDIPENLGRALGIGTFAAGLMSSIFFVMLIFVPLAIFSADSIYPWIFIGLPLLGVCVALGWMPAWFMIVTCLLVAAFWSEKMTGWISGLRKRG